MRESGKYKGWPAEESGDLAFVAGMVGGSRMGIDGRKRKKLVDTYKDSLPDQTLVKFLWALFLLGLDFGPPFFDLHSSDFARILLI